ncbi:MAG TPA: hypothetical protein VM582_00140, partial [Candidatus Thermoplasmatota archaeon]|nr:hypothetical protein [Candidatus Thermoplasmatota archaeon]
ASVDFGDDGSGGLALAHAGGPFRALLEHGAARTDVVARDLPPGLSIATDAGGRVSFIGSAGIAELDALVDDGAGTRYVAAFAGLPAQFSLDVTESPAGAAWTASGRTTRVALSVESAAGIAGFSRFDATLDDVPPSLTLSAASTGKTTLSAPGRIGRLTLFATNGPALAAPANGIAYLESGTQRALAASLPGVALLDVDLLGATTTARLVTAGAYAFTASATRGGEDVKLRIDGMPGDITFSYRTVTGGARVDISANARATFVRGEVTRSGEYYILEAANLPRTLGVQVATLSGRNTVDYAGSESATRLEMWTNTGTRKQLWARLASPVPQTFNLVTNPSSEDGYLFRASEHTTVDVFDDRAPGDYLRLENVRIRKLDVAYKGSSTGWLKLDTDWHTVKGRVKSETGSSGFEVDVRDYLRAENYRLDWWNYIPYDWDGSISWNDATIRIKSGGSWITIPLG